MKNYDNFSPQAISKVSPRLSPLLDGCKKNCHHWMEHGRSAKKRLEEEEVEKMDKDKEENNLVKSKEECSKDEVKSSKESNGGSSVARVNNVDKAEVTTCQAEVKQKCKSDNDTESEEETFAQEELLLLGKKHSETQNKKTFKPSGEQGKVKVKTKGKSSKRNHNKGSKEEQDGSPTGSHTDSSKS